MNKLIIIGAVVGALAAAFIGHKLYIDQNVPQKSNVEVKK